MRILLSYGHDGYVSLALRLKRDLQAVGHDVWFDVERLKPGGDWERYIEEGFDFVSKENEFGRLLLLMTPHSVRRPDGYCLNELARAYSRNVPIIPAMVSTVEPPLSICRLQWLDMRKCFPVEEHEDLYATQFGRLATALAVGQVPFEGVQQRLLHYLRPITYADDLTRNLARFTGRKWVMNEVEKWLASPSRVLWITGETGVGKSALAAWLCNKRPEIAAYHFCRFNNADRVDARRALFSLAYQLSTQLPVYQDRLNASPLDRTVVEANVPAVFDRLFVELLTDAVTLTHKPHVLLIDALDEAAGDRKNELASLIGSELNRLPPWLRVIVTSRPHEQAINFALQALDPWRLEADRPENLDDMRSYLRFELQPFTADGLASEQIVNAIVDKSEGLFLYASWICLEVQDGRLSLSEVQKFPRGLGGVYAEFFQRYFPDPREYASDCRPALEAVCSAREPLARRDLALLLGKSEYDMSLLTERLGSLFPSADGRVRPFHQSVRDWLTDPARSGPYWIDVRTQEQRLADLAWREFKAGVEMMGRYCITYAASHLAACQRKAEIKELLLDSDWIEAKLRTAGVASVISDYDLALEILSPKVGAAGAERPAPIPIGIPPWTMLQTSEEEASRPLSDERETASLRLVQGTIRLSSNVIGSDPEQLASQLAGRLMPYRDLKPIQKLLDRVGETRRTPWLRPLHSALHSPHTLLLRTLEGHSSGVADVAVTSNGRRVVSASYDKTLKVWDLETGSPLRTLESHCSGVEGVAVTPDGLLAVSASADNTLKVWDLQTGRPLHTLEGHSSPVKRVAVMPDGRRAVSASQDKTLKVWDLETGLAVRTLEGHSYAVSGLAVMPDGRRVVSASFDNTLRVWDLETGQPLQTIKCLSGVLHGLAVTTDGQRAVTASANSKQSWDRAVRVWDIRTGGLLRTLEGHSNSVADATVTPDGRRVVSASFDNTLRVWDLETGQPLQTLEGHSSWVNRVAVTPDGRRAVSASSDKTLKVWDISRLGLHSRTIPKLRLPEGHSAKVNGIAATPDGRRAVSASEDSTLKVWDIKTGRVMRTLKDHFSFVKSVAVTQDGRRAVSASTDGTLKVWNIKTGRVLRTLGGYGSHFSGVAVTPDSRRAVSASVGTTESPGNTLKVWDIEYRGVLSLKGILDRTIIGAAFPDRALVTLEGHCSSVNGVAMAPDGRRVVSASYDNTLKVWDLETGQPLQTLEGHSSPVNGVVVTPEGRWAVSASEDKTLKVWDLETGSVLRTLLGHSARVDAVGVTPDSQLAVSASDDKTLKVWELETGSLVATFTCDAPVLCCTFANGRIIVAGDALGRIHFLSLEGRY